LFVYAGLAGRTIGIQLADGLRRRSAVHVGIAQEIGGTTAHGQVVLGPALRSRGTGVVVDAGIHALLVLAGLVCGTVVVAAAADDAATLVRITTVSTQAAALGTVRLHIALGIGSTGIVDQARIDAVTVDAGLARIALAIHAASNGATGGIGITLESILAAAHCAMLGHLADGVGSTVARVAALGMDAGLLVGTVLVAVASWLTGRHHLAACSTGIGHLILGALTYHCSHRNTVQHTALGGLVAR